MMRLNASLYITSTTLESPQVTIDEKRNQFRLIVIITTSLLTVILVVLYTTSFLLTTSLESLTLLGILLTIYLIFIRQLYICMIGYQQKTITTRRRRSSARNYSSFRRFNSADNSNNSNNIEISMTSSDATNLIREVSQLNVENSVPENVGQFNRFATETMYVVLPNIGGQRSPGPPSYDEVIKMKPKFKIEEQPPNYAEAMKNIVKEK